MPIPLQTGLIYGPVCSRRLGTSLGVNLLPYGTKTCNFNCCYCQYGWTPLGSRGRVPAGWPSPVAVMAAVQMALARTEDVDRVTLAGHGEPTLYPMLRDLVRRLVDLPVLHARNIRLAILSNSSTARDPQVAEALGMLDDSYMKLDAGDPATLTAINASPISIDDIVEGLRDQPRVTLQAMFVRSRDRHVDNTTPARLDAWLDAVTRIRPIAVHIYSISRPPAWRQLEAIPREELRAIAARVEQRGIPAEVF